MIRQLLTYSASLLLLVNFTSASHASDVEVAENGIACVNLDIFKRVSEQIAVGNTNGATLIAQPFLNSGKCFFLDPGMRGALIETEWVGYRRVLFEGKNEAVWTAIDFLRR